MDSNKRKDEITHASKEKQEKIDKNHKEEKRKKIHKSKKDHKKNKASSKIKYSEVIFFIITLIKMKNKIKSF